MKKYKTNLHVIYARRQLFVVAVHKEKELYSVKVNELKPAMFISTHASNLTVAHLGEMNK